MTVAKAAKLLNTNSNRVKRLIAEGHLQAVQRLGIKFTYVRETQVNALKAKIEQSGGAK
jgi:excisionase family DNA binding protein